MKRIISNSVTEALLSTLEIAEEIEHVVIIYQTKKDSKEPSGFNANDEQEIATSNYLVDGYKAWLFKNIGS